jgi:hypothetical protein
MSFDGNKQNRGTHGDSSFMLDGLPSSRENPLPLGMGSVKGGTMTSFKSSFRNKAIDRNIFTQDMFPANFAKALIVDVDFSGFDIKDSDFTDATLINCNFANCDLTGVCFWGATLNSCNFVGAKINTHSIITWRTRFPNDVSGCFFDDNGIDALRRLDVMDKDAKKRADIWMDRHPARDRWVPGGKMDSPWHP